LGEIPLVSIGISKLLWHYKPSFICVLRRLKSNIMAMDNYHNTLDASTGMLRPWSESDILKWQYKNVSGSTVLSWEHSVRIHILIFKLLKHHIFHATEYKFNNTVC
jgi:hypothetical protein